MKKNKIKYILSFLLSASLLVGCGGGGGGNGSYSENNNYNPVTPDNDLPTNYKEAPKFNKKANEIYTYKSNTENLAVNLPTGSTYFVAITNTNTTQETQYISLVSSVSASIRVSETDEPQQSILANITDSLNQQERDEAKIEYRNNFINYLKQRNNQNTLRSVRAGIAEVDHSKEKVGEIYDIYTSDLRNGYVCLKCKLVAETKHAKFFVDQNNSTSYSCHKELMESFVKDGDFALTKVFEADSVNIYDFMSENFGDYINCDVDNDGKISVIITPFLSTLSSGYLGLFMHYCMLPEFYDPRDQIIIAPPINGQDSNYNRSQAVSNLCHEYQHLVNFSQRFYRNGKYSFNDDEIEKFNEEQGFDEGCSVCAEALFRRARGERGYFSLYDYKTGSSSSIEYTGNDSRFNNSFDYGNEGNFGNVFPFYPFAVSNYGRNGLFMLYLHDRFGKENFKKLIGLPFTGGNNTPGNEGLKIVIPQTLGTGESLDQLQRDWHFALQHEYLLTDLKKEGEALTTDARFKYSDCLRLNSHNKQINSVRSISLSKGYTTLFKLTPSHANSGNDFRFFIKSTGNSTYKNLEINIIKL